jgi:hypothetical protein
VQGLHRADRVDHQVAAAQLQTGQRPVINAFRLKGYLHYRVA